VTDPLPPLAIQHWNRVAGLLFFLWAMTLTSAWTVICATTVFVLVPFAPGPDVFFRVSRAWAAGILRFARVKTEIHIESPVPEGPVVFVCNHQSIIDIVALFVRLPRPFVFVAKKQVFRFPFLGQAITAMHYISVDRNDHANAVASLQAAALRIRSGLTTTLFPEGTRSLDGQILPFKKGPFMLALQAQVPIVPVAIEGSKHVTPKRQWYLCPNTVRILIGPAVPVAGLGESDRDALIATVRTQIIRMDRRLGGVGGDETTHIAARGWEGLGRPSSDAR
jgi:1-acyl-sn-glycerol-3-phosphate acyltransferase